MLMDVIPRDATLVEGSHGCRPVSRADWPGAIVTEADWLEGDALQSTAVAGLIQRAVG